MCKLVEGYQALFHSNETTHKKRGQLLRDFTININETIVSQSTEDNGIAEGLL